MRDVYHHGKHVAHEGNALFETHTLDAPEMLHSVFPGDISEESFILRSSKEQFPVIELVPDNILTKKREMPVTIVDGCVQADTERDLLVLACVERHRGSGEVGIGLVKGFNLKRGALASTVAHDSHNLMVVGTNPRDMYAAVKHLEQIQGGLVVVCDGEVKADLPLPIAGLLSTLPAEEVIQAKQALDNAAREPGVTTPFPFSQLSFLSLTVIPGLWVTAQGVFDVETLTILTV